MYIHKAEVRIHTVIIKTFIRDEPHVLINAGGSGEKKQNQQMMECDIIGFLQIK